MAFRYDESASTGFEAARRVLASSPSFEPSKCEMAERELEKLVDELGPVVEAYPTWHTLVPQFNPEQPFTVPHVQCGYGG